MENILKMAAGPSPVLMVVLKAVCQFVIGFTAGYLFISLVKWLFGAVAAFWVAFVATIAIWAWLIAMFIPARYLK